MFNLNTDVVVLKAEFSFETERVLHPVTNVVLRYKRKMLGGWTICFLSRKRYIPACSKTELSAELKRIGVPEMYVDTEVEKLWQHIPQDQNPSE